MERIFISYSRRDSKFVLKLVEDLEKNNVNTWLDQKNIEPGQLWDEEVQKNLNLCEKFIVILSPDSVNSRNVLDEINLSIDNQKCIFPVLYKECEIPFRISRIQYIDFVNDYENGFNGLLRNLNSSQKNSNENSLNYTEKLEKEIYKNLQRGKCVNLVSKKGARWRELTNNIKRKYINDMGIIDIDSPVNTSRKYFIENLFLSTGFKCNVPDEPDDLPYMGKMFENIKMPLIVALNNFDVIKYKFFFNIDFYSSIKFLVMQEGKLVLLINSNEHFVHLIPKNNPCSDLEIINIAF